jgi:hypothetical protein
LPARLAERVGRKVGGGDGRARHDRTSQSSVGVTVPAPVGRQAWLTTDPTAVGGDLRPPSTDPTPIGRELRASTDPSSIGSKLRLPTDPRAIGRELRGPPTDPRAVGGKACLRAGEGRGREDQGGDEGAHGDRDDTARQRGATRVGALDGARANAPFARPIDPRGFVHNRCTTG